MTDWEFDPFAPRRRRDAEEAIAEAAATVAPMTPVHASPPAAPAAPTVPDEGVPAGSGEFAGASSVARPRKRRASAAVSSTRDGDADLSPVADASVSDPPRSDPASTGDAGAGSEQPPGITAARPPGYRLSVKEMAPDERPRERLKLRGPQSLSDGDLLAILLNTGIVGETVTDVAQRLLAEHGGIRGLLRMETEELARVRGIGDAKAVRLKAALEIGRRLAALGAEARPKITSPDDAASLLQVEMSMLEQEQLRVVLLDTKHQVIAIRTVVQGSVNQAQVRVAEVYRDAVRQNAVALVAAHNHPSGDPTPSAADVSLTLELHQAGKLLGIDLLDHIILGQGRWVSLRRLGLGFPVS